MDILILELKNIDKQISNHPKYEWRDLFCLLRRKSYLIFKINDIGLIDPEEFNKYMLAESIEFTPKIKGDI